MGLIWQAMDNLDKKRIEIKINNNNLIKNLALGELAYSEVPERLAIEEFALAA